MFARMLKLTPLKFSISIVFLFSLFFLFSEENDVFNNLFEAVFNVSLDTNTLTSLNLPDYDHHLRSLKRGHPDPRIAIIEINEKSLQELGQFPFSRAAYAALIRKLDQAGASVVAFDITFPESGRYQTVMAFQNLKEELSGTKAGSPDLFKVLDEKIRSENGDLVLEDALRNVKIPVILGYAFSSQEVKTTREEQKESIESLRKRHFLLANEGTITTTNGIVNRQFGADINDRKIILPQQSLLDALTAQSGIGHFLAIPDRDSLIRKYSPVHVYASNFLGALAPAAISALEGGEKPVLAESNGSYLLKMGKYQMPLSSDASIYARYYGGRRIFPYYEFSDVIFDRIPKEKLKDKIFFVGATAQGQMDIRANPFDKNYPGVEVHATIASNILKQEFMLKNKSYDWFCYLALLSGMILFWLAKTTKPYMAVMATIASIVALQMLGNEFFKQGHVVPTYYPCLEFIVLLFGGILFKYLSEEKEKEYLRAVLSRYVSTSVMGELMRDQSKLKLGGQKKEITVLFCDMMGFTKIAEQMDAQIVSQLLNQYFTLMTNLILKNKGTLDKYMGDGLMCFWGAPLDLENHAELACQTALEMLSALDLFAKEWKDKHNLDIGIRIGIHTGIVSVGNMGSDQIFSYTAIGDGVNLSSRLETTNKIYKTRILVSSKTHEITKNHFRFRFLDEVKVKGRNESVKIFELVQRAQEQEPEWLRIFDLARENMKNKLRPEAMAGFKTCLALRPDDGPSAVFLNRLETNEYTDGIGIIAKSIGTQGQ